MKTRRILLTIDSIVALFKDYLPAEDMPETVVPLKLMINPQEKRKLAILCESLDWKEGLAPLQVKFAIKRFYGV